MSATQRLWGYKASGEACLFLIPSGGRLPAGWSPDVNVIADPELRTGEKVSAAAGASVHRPVPASPEAKIAAKKDALAEQKVSDGILRYDENNRPIPPPKNRVG